MPENLLIDRKKTEFSDIKFHIRFAQAAVR